MKTKLILLLAMMSFTQGQTLVNYIDGSYITSSVWYDGYIYHYEYRSDSKINKKDISNITINLCDAHNLVDIYADDKFNIEYTKTGLKFDDIDPAGSEFVFGFYSNNAPEINKSYTKASTNTYTDVIYSPSCQIPEPSYITLMSIGLLFILKKRR